MNCTKLRLQRIKAERTPEQINAETENIRAQSENIRAQRTTEQIKAETENIRAQRTSEQIQADTENIKASNEKKVFWLIVILDLLLIFFVTIAR